jgi:hypothetical protein
MAVLVVPALPATALVGEAEVRLVLLLLESLEVRLVAAILAVVDKAIPVLEV